MNRYMIAIAALVGLLGLVFLDGCGPTPEEAAAGTYALDPENIKAAAQKEMESAVDEMEKAQMQTAMEMIDQMQMSVTLNADGTASSSMSMMGQTQSTSGTWKISGETITLTMKEEGEEPSPVTGTLKNDTLEMDPPKGSDMPFEKLVFKKQPAK